MHLKNACSRQIYPMAIYFPDGVRGVCAWSMWVIQSGLFPPWAGLCVSQMKDHCFSDTLSYHRSWKMGPPSVAILVRNRQTCCCRQLLKMQKRKKEKRISLKMQSGSSHENNYNVLLLTNQSFHKNMGQYGSRCKKQECKTLFQLYVQQYGLDSKN